MKKVKLNRSIFQPKVGVFNKDQEPIFTDEFAKHVVKNMKAGEVVDNISTDEEVKQEIATKSTKKGS